MNNRTVTKPEYKNSTTFSPVFGKKLPGRTFTPEPAHEARDVSNSQLGHNFGNVQVERPSFIQSCPLTLSGPGHCPFGGACHTCAPIIQTKLKIGQPNDKYEQEADRVAEQVMRRPEPQRKACSSCNENDEEELIHAKPVAGRITPLVQRQAAIPEEEEEEEPVQTKLQVQRQVEEEEEEEQLQAKSEHSKNPKVMPKLTAHIQSLQGRGQPLPDSVRVFFEPRFGQDFRHVRVHTDTRLDDMVNGVKALAFTIGRDIVFGKGEYSPHSNKGKQLLAHELTHVVQQGHGGVKPNIQDRIQMKIGLEDKSEKATKTNWKKLGLKKGTKHKVDTMIADDIKRVFTNAAEANTYTSGKSDYMGDVKNEYWVKLEEKKTYVLGEEHKSSEGTVSDIIDGVDTKRFMDESVSELSSTESLKFPETQKRIEASLKKGGSSKFAGKISNKYPPALENIVIKTMVVPYFVSRFLEDAKSKTSDELKKDWPSAGPGKYTYSNTIAGLLTDAISIARDVKLKEYKKYKAFLDKLVAIHENDPYAGMWEFATARGTEKRTLMDAVIALEEFNKGYAKFASEYAENLGGKIAALKITENVLHSEDPRKDPSKVNEAREIIMLEKLKDAKAKGYLIVGMGDSHRKSLKKQDASLADEWHFVPDLLRIFKNRMKHLWLKLKY